MSKRGQEELFSEFEEFLRYKAQKARSSRTMEIPPDDVPAYIIKRLAGLAVQAAPEKLRALRDDMAAIHKQMRRIAKSDDDSAMVTVPRLAKHEARDDAGSEVGQATEFINQLGSLLAAVDTDKADEDEDDEDEDEEEDTDKADDGEDDEDEDEDKTQRRARAKRAPREERQRTRKGKRQSDLRVQEFDPRDVWPDDVSDPVDGDDAPVDWRDPKKD